MLFLLLSASAAMCQNTPDTIMFKTHKVEWFPTTTKYKPGFRYHTKDGFDVTLLEWEKMKYVDPKVPKQTTYRWRALYEGSDARGATRDIGWTDDISIDLATGKIIFWEGQYYEPIKAQQQSPKP